jgi:RNase P/RNase MRP subunit POP5
MKPLKPTMKENKRYLLIKGKNLKENIEKAILDFIGISGRSECGLSLIESNNNFIIICINREAVDLIRASLCVFPEKIEVIKVSGTLKRLKK